MPRAEMTVTTGRNQSSQIQASPWYTRYLLRASRRDGSRMLGIRKRFCQVRKHHWYVDRTGKGAYLPQVHERSLVAPVIDVQTHSLGAPTYSPGGISLLTGRFMPCTVASNYLGKKRPQLGFSLDTAFSPPVEGRSEPNRS